jgi:hypothetical protein
VSVQNPLEVHADGQTISGQLRLQAHAAQSYDIHIEVSTPGAVATGAATVTPVAPQRAAGTFDLKDPYYRQLRSTWWPPE